MTRNLTKTPNDLRMRTTGECDRLCPNFSQIDLGSVFEINYRDAGTLENEILRFTGLIQSMWNSGCSLCCIRATKAFLNREDSIVEVSSGMLLSVPVYELLELHTSHMVHRSGLTVGVGIISRLERLIESKH